MPEASLFRQEVVEARRGEWLGSIIIAAPLSRWPLNALAAALATAMLLFLVFGHCTRRETVTGQMVPSTGLLNVVAPRAGAVSQLRVHDGEVVKAGELLLELSSTQDSAALGNTLALIGQQLDTQRSRLQADLANQQQLARQQADALRGKIVLLQAQIDQIAVSVRRPHLAPVRSSSAAACDPGGFYRDAKGDLAPTNKDTNGV